MIFIKNLQIFIFLIFSSVLYSDKVLFSDDILKKYNLVDVQSLDPSIGVQLMYATTNNFLNKNVYGDLRKCYLLRNAAEKLTNAQRLLKENYPGYSLLIYDGLRPRKIQYQMWEIVMYTSGRQYVANPKGGSIHNYGAAIDLTIADEEGKPLDMGTSFDYFGVKAQPRYEKYFRHPELLKSSGIELKIRNRIDKDIKFSGQLNDNEISNRLLLRSIMEKAGFKPIMNEWWHFNAFPEDIVRKKFKIIE